MEIEPAVETAGSIPACAGEPRDDPGTVPYIRVYPRVCGGTFTIPIVQVSVDGLSPRVRGNRAPRDGDSGAGGSIPACAGEPDDHTLLTVATRVYPRVCGGTSAP